MRKKTLFLLTGFIIGAAFFVSSQPAAAASITVIAPNGGEQWVAGTTYTVSWNSSGISSVKIYLLWNEADGSPSSQELVSQNTSSTNSGGSFNWIIPQNQTARLNYRIQASDASKSMVMLPGVDYDMSDGYFTIANGDVNGDGAVNCNDYTELNDMYLGKKTPNAASDVNGDGLKAQISDLQKLINVLLAKGLSCSTQPSITVLSPNGGETWTEGTTQIIKWQDNSASICPAGPHVKCFVANTLYDITLADYSPPCPVGQLCALNPSALYTIAKSVSGSSYLWGVGKILNLYDALVSDGSYIIQVCRAGTDICDSSDSYFKITSAITKPFITVLSPNGGETWARGATQTIKWQYNPLPCPAGANCTAPIYDIKLNSYDSTSYTIAQSVSGSSYSWIVGNVLRLNDAVIPQGNYTIQVCQSGICDSSDSYFKIMDSGAPSITVLSPNGGETWGVGKTYEIKWKWANNSLNLPAILTLLDANKNAVKNIKLDVAGESYLWTIPSDIRPGKYYVNAGNGIYCALNLGPACDSWSAYDTSDAVFNIVDTPSVCTRDVKLCSDGSYVVRTGPNCEFAACSVYSILEGDLIRAIGDADIWIVKYVGNKKFKRLILSPSVFDSYSHLKWGDVKDVDKSVVDSFVTSDLIRAANDGKVFKLYPAGDTGQKRWVTTVETFSRLGFDWDAIYTINQADWDSYNAGLTIK